MPEISGSKLAEFTGMGWRTVKRRLQDARIEPVRQERNADLYESTEALPALYAESGSGQELDLQAERARLAKAQADKTEIENAVRAGQLLEESRVVREVGDMLASFRARVIAIPDAVGQHFDPGTAKTVVREIRARLYEALEELAGYRPRVPVEAGEDPGAAADPDSESVGGSKAPPVERKQRRARTVEN